MDSDENEYVLRKIQGAQCSGKNLDCATAKDANFAYHDGVQILAVLSFRDVAHNNVHTVQA